MAGLNRCSAIGFVAALLASISVHPSAAASGDTRRVTFYLQGTCLCDVSPTSQEALGLAGGYLSSAGSIKGIGYPAGLLFAADAVIGSSTVNATLAAMPENTHVTLAGVSQGAIVLNYVKLSRALRNPLGRPAADKLQFVTFGDPQNTTGGITTKNRALQLFAPNVPVETAYPTTEIVREYDGFSDWPDKPTRLAVLNAVMGIGYVHTDYGSAADPTTPGTLKTVHTNAQGGTTTHYVVPTARLPLTEPLRDIGLNTSLIDALLRPQIDRAYNRRPQVAIARTTTPAPAEPARTNPRGAPVAEAAHPQAKAADRGQRASAPSKDTTAAAGTKPSGSDKETKDQAPKPRADTKTSSARKR